MPRTFFIAATRQHVGKTSVSMGFVQGLQRRFRRPESVAFGKPVGQQHLEIDGMKVDKDVQVLKEHFGLVCKYEDMSPVLVPRGYTKDFIDGKRSEKLQEDAILQSFEALSRDSDVVVLEGTGHTGVGTIVNMNNAKVASMLGAEMILIANGGLGSAFDELELNRCMCKEYGVKISGVIINKVLPDRVDMIREYFGKLLERWDLPLLGVVPDERFLGKPSLLDFEQLFDVSLLAGQKHRLRHYNPSDIHLAAHGLNRFIEMLSKAPTRPLYVTHASRADIVLCFLSHVERAERLEEEFGGALILCGRPEGEGIPHQYTLDAIASADTQRMDGAPVMYIPKRSWEVISEMNAYVPKLNIEDKVRCGVAADHYEKYLDFDMILR